MPLILGVLQVASFNFSFGWVTIFLYTFIFLLTSSYYKKAAIQGFMYGVAYFFIHSWGCVVCVDYHNLDQWRKIFPIIFFTIYALQSSLWWLAVAYCKSTFKGALRYISISIITCLFWMWIHGRSLIVYGVWNMGYPLLYPLTPIVYNPLLRDMFYKCGMWISTFFIFFISGVWMYMIERSCYSLYMCTISGVLIGCIMYQGTTQDTYSYRTHLHYLQPLHSCYSVSHILHDLTHKAQQYLQQIQGDVLFFTPETAITYPLTNNNIRFLYDNITGHNSHIQLVLGCNVEDPKDQKVYNSIFILQDSRIILRYDKKLLLPFGEYIPVEKYQITKKILGFFLTSTFSYNAGNLYYNEFFYIDNHVYIPVLCSELFWKDYQAYPEHVNIACLLRDCHFGDTLLPHIMLLYGQFIAGTQKRSVIMIGNKKGFFIGKNGLILKYL